jgi:hypothetical protein
MRDADKPFVMYRRSRFNFNIVPRGPRGWFQLGLWLALLAPTTIAFAVYAEAHEGKPAFYVALGVYMVALLIWSVALTFWAKARTEVVDVEEMLRLQRGTGRKGRGR